MLSSRKTICMLLVCLSVYATGTAQQTTAVKPKLFANLPSSILISENLLQSFFSLSQNQETILNISSGFNFPCRVLSNEIRYSNLQTIILKSASFDDAIFQISRIVNDDRSLTYTGRIINSRAFDGFVIKKDAAGIYQLEKFETDQVLEVCTL